MVRCWNLYCHFAESLRREQSILFAFDFKTRDLSSWSLFNNVESRPRNDSNANNRFSHHEKTLDKGSTGDF
jgi:hypothetical protein